MKLRSTTLCLLSLLLLTSCFGKDVETTEEETAETGSGEIVAQKELPASVEHVSGAKAAAYAISFLNNVGGLSGGVRPSSTMGIFTSIYLSSGKFINTASAKTGIEVQMQLIAGQRNADTSENFALLKEFGSVLQVDVVDLLNRSERREEALDAYLASLANISQLVTRKTVELTSLEEDLTRQKREKKDEVRTLEREINDALREQNYEGASVKQGPLIEAQGEVARLESQISQTDDILKRFEDLLDIADERAVALTVNRRVVLAGLKVIEVPGIDDFEILDTDTRVRNRKNRSRQAPSERLDPLGIFK